MQQRQVSRRRNRLPQPRFQFRLAWQFAGLCLVAVLLNTMMIGVGLTMLAQSAPVGGVDLARSTPGLLVKTTLMSLAVVIPAVVLIGIAMAFRIAGPVYRFERHLEGVIRGDAVGECSIRKGDDLQDLCGLLNQGLEAARLQGERGAETDTNEPEAMRAA